MFALPPKCMKKLKKIAAACVAGAIMMCIYIPMSWLFFQFTPEKPIFEMGNTFVAGSVSGFVGAMFLIFGIGSIFVGLNSISDSIEK